MTPNNEANNGNSNSPSPLWTKNVGRLSRLTSEERKAIARKGGLATSEKKRLSSQLNPIKTGTATTVINIARCDECPIKTVCHLYKPNSACRIELNIRRNLIGQFKAFVGIKPENMLMEIMKTYGKLEKIVEDKPSYYKLSQLMYLLMSIYKMKFGEKAFITGVKVSSDNPSLDVKEIMEKLRE